MIGNHELIALRTTMNHKPSMLNKATKTTIETITTVSVNNNSNWWKKLNYGVQNSILFISVVSTRKINVSILEKMKNENILTLINAVYFTLQST
jgi:hypothetical protein